MKNVTRSVSVLLTALVATLGMGVLSPAANAAVNTCGSYVFGGDASGGISNGTLKAGFCIGSGSIRRINVLYEKTGGSTTNVRLGYQETDSSGVGISPPVYAAAQNVNSGQTAERAFSVTEPIGCYHGVMLNTLTGYQYVTRVWGSC
ncbi:hypothetical protein F4562_003368 [Streptosporangium becharense]|uniref:Spore-associated protein A n=1 Tax=Streptosporangium becharense TaxID=1816182 RepID=A0A7W9IGU1_9ACTN|nr:hypothetical protein [Streptosporangium becharense]